MTSLTCSQIPLFPVFYTASFPRDADHSITLTVCVSETLLCLVKQLGVKVEVPLSCVGVTNTAQGHLHLVTWCAFVDWKKRERDEEIDCRHSAAELRLAHVEILTSPGKKYQI